MSLGVCDTGTRPIQCLLCRTLHCGFHERLEIKSVSKGCSTHGLVGVAFVVRAPLLSVALFVAHRLWQVARLLALPSLGPRVVASRTVAVTSVVCWVVDI